VFNRTAAKLRSPPVNNPPDQWISVPDRFEPIVSREVFNRAKGIYKKRIGDADTDEMLARLRALLAKHSRLSGALIDAEKGMLTAQTYQRRFGSLMEAYRRIGWDGERRYRHIGMRPRLRSLQLELEQAITGKLAETADFYCKDTDAPRWRVNGELSLHAAVVCSRKGNERRRRVWTFYGNRRREADVLVLARLNHEGDKLMDYFVFPGGYTTPIRMFEGNPRSLEIHKFPDLNFLEIVCRRSSVEEGI
jgi:hypothetical protein